MSRIVLRLREGSDPSEMIVRSRRGGGGLASKARGWGVRDWNALSIVGNGGTSGCDGGEGREENVRVGSKCVI
jgi:hypothetical protein